MLERNGRKALYSVDYEHKGRLSNLTDAPLRVATQAAQGYGGSDLRVTNMTSVKACRTSDRQNKAPVNVKTRTGLTTGLLDGDHTSRKLGLKELPALAAHNPKGPQNKRARAKLRKALKTAR